MDTRTYYSAPSLGAKVGWNRASEVTGASGTHYHWGGDNIDNGFESAYFHMQNIRTDLSPNNLTIKMDAFWFNQTLNGNVQTSFSTYKGGTMELDGFNWINNGGELLAEGLMFKNILTNSGETDIDGDNLSTLNYDLMSGRFLFF